MAAPDELDPTFFLPWGSNQVGVPAIAPRRRKRPRRYVPDMEQLPRQFRLTVPVATT
jgi:hypothetical protein